MFISDLRADLLEASEACYHREVARLQMRMFEEIGEVRRHLVVIANGQLLKDGMAARPRIVESATVALNQTWEQIRAQAYQAIARVREQKDERDRNIRGFVPRP
jgi:hypothetical protein